MGLLLPLPHESIAINLPTAPLLASYLGIATYQLLQRLVRATESLALYDEAQGCRNRVGKTWGGKMPPIAHCIR